LTEINAPARARRTIVNQKAREKNPGEDAPLAAVDWRQSTGRLDEP
jgi:hypothetical protein